MAEAAVLAGLGWLASPIVGKIINKASRYLDTDIARELRDLETAVLPQLKLMVEAAKKSVHKDALKLCLQRLKASYYDIEDLLDEHEYKLLKRRVKDPSLGDDATSNKRKLSNLFLPKKRSLIEEIHKHKDILAEAKDLRDLLGLEAGVSATAAAPVATTTSVLPESKVFGRDKDRDGIVDVLLRNTTAATYSSLAIVGAGGMGKSTLAKYVYNDKRIQKHFGCTMWVSISHKLDVRRHTQEILESARTATTTKKGVSKKTTTKEGYKNFCSLDALQHKIKKKLQSHKCLLVLDDVWFQESVDNEIDWHLFLAPLVNQAGSKVLVTSRRSTFPGALLCEQVLPLDNMDDSEFLALLKHYAFSVGEINQVLRSKLEEIAKQIAKKLGQSPLAAQVMGYQLNKTKEVTAWRDALRTNNLNEPMRVLMWSYEKLDPHLQMCFSFCSLFPKGHKFKIDELVHLWVAEGFVDSSCDPSKTMEDVGKDYFNEMVSGSFFQLFSTGFYDSCYIMHDLLHELAQSLSSEDCFRLEDDKVTTIPPTVRHLSVRVESIKKHKQIIVNLRHLRTVICIDPLIDDVKKDIFREILQNLKKLRVLSLLCYNTSKLPKSVGKLKHLRYLNLVKTFISELPRSLGNLYHLQFLQLNHRVKSLPDEVCNLSELRHLEGYDDIKDSMRKIVLPQLPNIGKLTSLQKLDVFSVRKEMGHELKQLGNMNELGGRLNIKNIENVSGKDEALESKLDMKSHLKDLELEWSSQNDSGTENTVHFEILEGLEPPAQLEYLLIIGYQSANYPPWLLNGSHFENLLTFGLENCSMVQGLPRDTLFQNCHTLSLRGALNLRTLPCLPQGLENLYVDGCPLLMFVANDDQERIDLRGNIKWTDQFVSGRAFVTSQFYIIGIV